VSLQGRARVETERFQQNSHGNLRARWVHPKDAFFFVFVLYIVIIYPIHYLDVL